jgi:hypothetical protein
MSKQKTSFRERLLVQKCRITHREINTHFKCTQIPLKTLNIVEFEDLV